MRLSPPPSIHERHITRRGVLWLGLRCDVRCKFCYDSGVKDAEKIWIDVDQAIDALAKFRSYYLNTSVDFMGGEPTLHPHILELVTYASGIGLRPTVVTHGMHLADFARASEYAKAGIGDFLVSIHGVGDTARAIHGRGTGNFGKQLRGLDNLRELGIPVRFNCILIRDNLTQLFAIAELAAEKGVHVINFLSFNPYFEWSESAAMEFQIRYSEIAPYLGRAIDRCSELGIEANVRYVPPCLLPGYEAHVYTGFQLPFDAHEWDYNSWYDQGFPGTPPLEWYLEASLRQQIRHHYTYALACRDCAVRAICDGFHAQYLSRWGGDEATPYSGSPVIDPCHFISRQKKFGSIAPAETFTPEGCEPEKLTATQFSESAKYRAGVKREPPTTASR